MTGPSFVDTNVLVYADDRSHPDKREVARELLRRVIAAGNGKLSTQVLSEFFSVATRKLGLVAADARRRVEIYGCLEVVRPSLQDVLAAIDLHRLHEVAIWDALIIRCAQRSGCTVLYSEDLQHGQRFDGVVVVDPFR